MKPNLTSKSRKAQAREKTITILPSPSLQSIYVNSAQISTTNWDMRILLGEVLDANQDQVTIEPKARVIMSHEHAKAFYEALGQSLEKHKQESAAWQARKELSS